MPLAAGSLGDLWNAGRLGTDAEALCEQIFDAGCVGLGAMHEAGYVHRDVTPRNILGFLDADEPTGYWWVIVDCGLARALVGDTGTDLTQNASRLGTPGYMAPESYGAPHLVTEAADAYGLGRVLGHLLTGERPDPCERSFLTTAHGVQSSGRSRTSSRYVVLRAWPQRPKKLSDS